MNNKNNKNISEHFESRDVVNSCYYVCQNLTKINIILTIIMFILGYMFLEQYIKKIN